jgi:anti-sigma regulatory factor (Ser/Thr protein kinase)
MTRTVSPLPRSDRPQPEPRLGPPANAGFRHEARFYDGMDDFVSMASSFVRGGLEADDSMLVATSPAQIDALRSELGAEAMHVEFAPMSIIGRNPATIIPRWRRFVEDGRESGRAARGIGEPIWAGRSPAELAECHRHEALLNHAFGPEDPFWLVCPYDVGRLGTEVLDTACSTHPVASDRHGVRPPRAGLMFDMAEPLPPPPTGHLAYAFEGAQLRDVRAIVEAAGAERGLHPHRVADLVLASDEIATNSILHGGGSGTLRVWAEDGTMVVEITDSGHITDPLLGRISPAPDSADGRGLWIVNQLCDLVQLRSGPKRTVVRLRMSVER